MRFPNNLIKYSHVFPYNNTNIIWTKGDLSNAEGASTELLGSFDWPFGTQTIATGTVIDLSSYLGLPWQFPPNISRNISVNITSPDANWEDWELTVLYKNPYGLYMQKVPTPLPTTAGINNGLVIGNPFDAAPNFVNRFYYPSEIVSMTITKTGGTTNPSSTLYFGVLAEGCIRFPLQDSTRFNSGSIQILKPAANTEESYTVYIDNYPQFVSKISPNYDPLGNDNIFGNSPANPYTGAPVTSSPFPLPQLDTLLAAPFELGASTTDATDSQLARIPYAVGNITVDVLDTNVSDMLVSVIQNGISF